MKQTGYGANSFAQLTALLLLASVSCGGRDALSIEGSNLADSSSVPGQGGMAASSGHSAQGGAYHSMTGSMRTTSSHGHMTQGTSGERVNTASGGAPEWSRSENNGTFMAPAGGHWGLGGAQTSGTLVHQGGSSIANGGTSAFPFAFLAEPPTRLAANTGDCQVFDIADIDQDGDSDLVFANFLSTKISVWFGGGDGSFAKVAEYAMPSEPMDVKVTDVNRDDIPDVIVAAQTGYYVSVFPGIGAGALGESVDYHTSGQPSSIAVGNVGRDNTDELVIGYWSETYSDLCYFEESGNLDKYSVANGQTSPIPKVFLVDLDDDQDLDIAVFKTPEAILEIYLNNGLGAYAPVETYSLDAKTESVTFADLNGDRLLDVATANFSNGSISLLYGTSGGQFGPRADTSLGGYLMDIAAGDLNGDGWVDLAVSDRSRERLWILRGTSSGVFELATSYSAPGQLSTLRAHDFNHDGYLDLMVSAFWPDGFQIFLNAGRT